MSAGTVVIAGGILATVILLTIVAVLCLCRLQYYCCKREESEKEEGEEPEIAGMSPFRPLAPPSPPTPDHYNDEAASYSDYPPTFLTEPNGPTSYSPPLVRRPPRSHTFCPSCARYALPYYLQHPCERLCNGGRRVSYRTVRQHEMDLPTDLASLYHKLNLIRSVTMREVVTHSVSTDV